MPFRSAAFSATAVLVAALASGPAAQAPGEPATFGTADEAIATLSGLAFRPESSSTAYTGAVTTGRWVTGGPSRMSAPLPEIPNGALLTQVAFHIQDTDAAADFTGSLCRHWTDSADGTNPGSDCPVTISSTGTGQALISAAPNLLVSYRFNVDGDATVEAVSYTLSGDWGGSTTGSIKLRQARLLWKRQVSPAPTTARFADVPVGHPLHQFVEALAASGITGGCAAGMYCPDALVTRGQMAVFLSAALGLHWPAF